MVVLYLIIKVKDLLQKSDTSKSASNTAGSSSLIDGQSGGSTIKNISSKSTTTFSQTSLTEGGQTQTNVIKSNQSRVTSGAAGGESLFEDQSQSSSIKVSTTKTVAIASHGDISAIHGHDTYTHDQGTSSAVWTIQHNLDKHPSVTAVDTAGSVVFGSVDYIDNNKVIVTFNAPFSGLAYFKLE